MTSSELMKNELGYTSITTFWSDFCIAEHFGFTAIRSAFNHAFR